MKSTGPVAKPLLLLCFVMAAARLAITGQTFDRNELMVRWLANGISASEDHDLNQDNAIQDAAFAEEFAAFCSSETEAHPARSCLFRDMAMLRAGKLEVDELTRRIEAYSFSPWQRASLAALAGDFLYRHNSTEGALLLWSHYLPMESRVYRAALVASDDEFEIAATLLRSVPNQTLSGTVRNYLSRTLVSMARHSHLVGNYRDAEQYWRRAIIQWPDRPTYYIGLVRSLGAREQWDESADALRLAVLLRPEFTQYRIYEAQALLFAQRFCEAEAIARQVLEVEPENAVAAVILEEASKKRSMGN